MALDIFAKIFGKDEVVKSGLNMIDNAFYTKQEQADDGLKRVGFHMAFLKLYEPFKLAQRFLALIFGIPFVSVFILIAINWLVAIWLSLFFLTGEQYDFLVAQFKEIAMMNVETLGFPVALIMGFYFGGGAIEGVVAKYANVKHAGAKK